ncbi:kinase-like protein [Hypoxylon sp. FL1284]|nr:kinase-like protein [Hypoxylon sp. FL1284]
MAGRPGGLRPAGLRPATGPAGPPNNNDGSGSSSLSEPGSVSGSGSEVLEEPQTYEEFFAQRNIEMSYYRSQGKPYSWEPDEVAMFAEYWRRPWRGGAGRPPLFTRLVGFAGFPFEASERADLDEDAALRLDTVRSYFNQPRIEFQKVLGAGGNGLNLHYKNILQDPPRDFVVKVALRGWNSKSLRKEILMTRRMRRAAHCVQSLEPEELDRLPVTSVAERPAADDSSEEDQSSGDESVDFPNRLPRLPRNQVTPGQQAEKNARWRERLAEWNRNEERNSRMSDRPRFDYLFLQYLPGGDLENLIARFQRATLADQPALAIPNRVLWGLWLCLVRACVAMKYPPRKFHPFRPRPPRPPRPGEPQEEYSRYLNSLEIYPRLRGELIENLPPPERRFRSKNMVHFDIDPSNFLLGDPETIWPGPDRTPTEHFVLPTIKIADFGLAEMIKPHKRNYYYFDRRTDGKTGFIAPEQFGSEWEFITPDLHGPELSQSEIAGNYGSHTNVWGIALTMWCLITQREPAVPPQPQLPPGVQVSQIPLGMPIDQYIVNFDEQISRETGAPYRSKISYCPWLNTDGGPNGFFNYVDPTLRRTIHECMFHQPGDRPTIEFLLNQARVRAASIWDNESDQFIQDWANTYIYSAPTV